MKLLLWATLSLVVGLTIFTTTPVSSYVTTFPEEPDIDGILITVALTIGHWFAGLLPYPGIAALINAILNAWKPRPEDDYWENVEQQVQDTCGAFINQDNVDKVLVYKDDVMAMLNIYKRSPVHGDGSYPDKNTQADAITTSIITNRYLIEAALMPWSLTLYFMDIASIHLLILKDVAESYSFEGMQPSQWWSDLSNELEHYDQYAQRLFQETLQFRKDNIECYFDEGWTLDTYKMTDHITGITDTCVQEHPEDGQPGSCANACSVFESQMKRGFESWYQTYVGEVVQQWRVLKETADQMASRASKLRVPVA